MSSSMKVHSPVTLIHGISPSQDLSDIIVLIIHVVVELLETLFASAPIANDFVKNSLFFNQHFHVSILIQNM